MGYSTTFRIKGKLDEQFVSNSWINTSHENIRKSRLLLVSSCMKNWENNESIAYDEIFTRLKMYILQLEEKWKKNLTSKIDEENEYTKKGEVDFYGWEYAENDNVWTKESLDDYFIETLFLIAVSNGGNRFNEESDYHKKLEEVTTSIDDIEDCVNRMMDGLFIERYRDCGDADEDDGYKHRFPEEDETTEDINKEK